MTLKLPILGLAVGLLVGCTGDVPPLSTKGYPLIPSRLSWGERCRRGYAALNAEKNVSPENRRITLQIFQGYGCFTPGGIPPPQD